MEDLSSFVQAHALSPTTILEPFSSNTSTKTVFADTPLRDETETETEKGEEEEEAEAEETTIGNQDKGHYKLRALNLNNNISTALEANWPQSPQLPASLNVNAFSSELVNETLNYFVNCGKRLSQMTKTYDDNDAYILLLQEKEVDLELAARIGQNLLRQNKELKESVASLKEELDKRQDHVQQLKHELASKTVLLGTLIEEEENQSSLEESEPTSSTTLLRCQDQSQPPNNGQLLNSNNTKHSSQPVVIAGHDFNYDDDHGPNSFLSLNYSSPKPSSQFPVEPFSSLPHYLTLNTPAPNSHTSFRQHQNHFYDQQHQHHDFVEDADSNTSSLSQDEEELNPSACQVLSGSKTTAHTAGSKQEQPEFIKTVTFQLVESNKRLCELQDEIFYKSEQNSMQQEKILSLQEQLRESDRRLGDVASDNETLLKSMDETKEIHKELTEELRVCKRNFNELLRVFLAMQKESRILRNETIQRNSTLNYLGEEEVMMQDDDFINDTYDSFNPTKTTTTKSPYNNHHQNSTPCESCRHGSQSDTYSNAANNRTNISASPSLLEELQETLRNKDKQQKKMERFQASSDEEEEEESGNEGGYENDSGVMMNANTNNNTSSATPTTYTLTDTETEDRNQLCENQSDDGRSWLGFSSFVITTILLLCLSVTFRSSSNGSLPRKLQLKLD